MEDRTASSVHAVSDREHRGSPGSGMDDVARSPSAAASSDEHVEYWRRTLAGAIPLQLPVDRRRLASDPSIATTDRLQLRLPTALKKRLENLARQRHVSLFAVLCGSWAMLLSRWCTQEDLVIGARWTRRSPAGEVAVQGIETAVPLRLTVDELAPLEAFLRQVESALTQTCAHTGASMDSALAALSGGEEPLLRAAISYSELGRRAFLAPTQARTQSPVTSSDFALVLEDIDGVLIVRLEYAGDLFDRQTIRRMADGFKTLLHAVSRHAGRPIGRLAMLTGAERNQVLYRNNATLAHYPRERLIHELFEARAARVPCAPALICGNEALSYAQVNAQANRLAHYLHHLGLAAPRGRVGLCLERGIEMGIAILGVLKAGAAYVPLDPNYPPERLAYLMSDATPSVILTHSSLIARLRDAQIPCLALDALGEAISYEDDRNPIHPTLSAEDLAYVMYTSGSTGQPKGVMVRHRNVVNYACYAVERFDIEQGAGSLIGTSMNFDLALTGFYPPLVCGRAVTFCGPEEDLSHALLAGRNYAPVKLTPTHLSILSLPAEQIAGRVRTLVVGGELLQASALRWWREHSPETRIFNHYGPTETTIGCVVHEVPFSLEGPVPIGKPIANTQIYLLDAHRLPVPIGVIGEIYIGGDGVAAGYWNRPTLTDEKFLVDPFSDDPRARMYKTGDVGRWRADGTIEYLGRNDDQVKIRGFRVELGEIAAKLREHVLVKEAVVIAREDTPGDKRLVAYLTRAGADSGAEGRSGALSAHDLRAYLHAALPDYMIPSAFVVMERLPLTHNAKLDRRALPVPDTEAFARQPFEAPRGEQEALVATIWRDLFKTERIGRHDNFFELGGHSLLAFRLRAALHAQGWAADVRSIYDAPSLGGFTERLVHTDAAAFEVPARRIPERCEHITPQMLPLIELTAAHIERIVAAVEGGAPNIQDIYPLAPLQEGILFHHLLHSTSSDAYVQPTLLSVSSAERLNEVIRALQTIIDRHEALRTALLWDALPQPVQVVYRKVTLPVETLQLDPALEVREQLEAWMAPERQRMDLTQAPLVRLKVAADPWTELSYVILQVHHIASDHESMASLLRELSIILQGKERTLAAPAPYRDHVARTRHHASSHEGEAFFRSKLADVDEPTAPFGLTDTRGDGRRVDEAHASLDPALAARVRAQARRLGVSAATLFHAAWALWVAHASNREDVVFGTVLLGRLQAASSDGALGMFINTLPMRIRLQAVTAQQLIDITQRELVDLLAHEQVSLSVAQNASGVGGGAPLFSALLNYLHGALRFEAEEGRMGTGVHLLARRKWTNFPIVVSVEEQPEAFLVTAQTDRRVDPRRLIAHLLTTMESLVTALERAPGTLALSLSVLPEEERAQVLASFNATTRAYPREQALHHVFEQVVRATPNAVAVTDESHSLTYAQLNARANQLAWSLRAQGVKPGESVVILMERSLAQVISQLAILKCGAVYVPIDPSQPAQRQAFILQDCGARCVITDDAQAPVGMQSLASTPSTLTWISYHGALQAAGASFVENIASEKGAASPAYVMYTSGSTGAPKGVLVAQHAVASLAINNEFAQISSTDGIAYCSNPMFDASTFEVWGALLNGAKLVIVPQAVVFEPDRFAEALERQGVTILWLTIGLLTQYADALAGAFSRLRYLITGGDVVDPAVVHRVLSNGPPRHFLNAYGPTECTTFTTTFEIEGVSAAASALPIGRPISNVSVYVLNTALQPVPIGGVGEIYIGGVGVALGYLNQPALTAQRFVPEIFAKTPGGRLYRTGDLGRWRADGNLEFVGRNDQQVKLRGFRIELGEIESHILGHQAVKEAVVIARARDAGPKRLIAYVVARGETTLRAEMIRDYLAPLLPEYMVPSAVVVLPQLPLTPNGKLDRRALPDPASDAFVSRPYHPPVGDVEELIAALWREVLRVDRIGRHDHFFELGGHSLLAMQVMVRLRSQLALEVAISELFDHPVLDRFAACVERRREAALDARLTAGGADIDELLKHVASMPEHEVRKVMAQLRKEVQS